MTTLEDRLKEIEARVNEGIARGDDDYYFPWEWARWLIAALRNEREKRGEERATVILWATAEARGDSCMILEHHSAKVRDDLLHQARTEIESEHAKEQRP